MVGGGGGCMPLLCGQCSRPLGQGKFDTWLANVIQFVSSTLPAYLMCDLVFICMFSYVRMKTLKLNVAYLNIWLKFVTTVLMF